VVERLPSKSEALSSNPSKVGCQWLTPVILDTQEAEIRRIEVQSQPWQIVCKTLSPKKKKITKKGW
jgi:hypothetical protein